MKSKSLSARFFRNQRALLMMLSLAPFHAQARGPGQDRASALEMAKKMQQEAATAELQVTLDGNLKDFSIATGESSCQASRLAHESQVSAAVAAYREALKMDPDNAELHFDLSLALAKLRDSRSAREELETAIRLDRNLANGRNEVGILHMVDNEKAKAEDEFKAAISADSRFVEAKNNLGVLYAWTGKDLEAIELFRLAIQGRPNYASAHVNLGL